MLERTPHVSGAGAGADAGAGKVTVAEPNSFPKSFAKATATTALYVEIYVVPDCIYPSLVFVLFFDFDFGFFVSGCACARVKAVFHDLCVHACA